MEETTFADIQDIDVFSFIFKENLVLIEKDNPSEKIVAVEKELDGIDGDDLENLVENLLEMLPKRRSQKFYKPVDVHSVTNAIGESISSISIWNIVN